MHQAQSFLTDRAIAIAAEDKIRAAYANGEFDHLSGFGQPHPIIDGEYDPNWWIREKLRREGLLRILAETLDLNRPDVQHARCSIQD